MLNILMISEAQAKHVAWAADMAHSHLIFISAIFVILTIVMFGIACGCDDSGHTFGMVIFDILGCFSIFCILLTGFNSVSTIRGASLKLDYGAANNVSCYHKMKYLRHVYPHLRKHSTTDTKSLAYDDSMTKAQARSKYQALKYAYRNTDQHSGNGTTSLHAYLPHWWQVI